jgi:signal transduction histidine kinase
MMVLNADMNPRTAAWLPSISPLGSVSLLLYALAGLGFVYVQVVGLASSSNLPLRAVTILLVLLGLFWLDRWEHTRHADHPTQHVAHSLLGARMLLVSLAVAVDGFHLCTGLLALVPLRAFSMLERRAATAWTVFAFALLTVALTVFKANWFASSTYFYTAMLAFLALGLAVYVALIVRRERDARLHSEQLLTELEVSHRQLSAYAERVAELATLEERNRVAREIHDSLGHYLTAINIQLEKAVVFNDKKPIEALTATRDAKRLADEALEDVRRSVGALRDAQHVFHLWPALERLVQTVREGSDLEVRLELQGEQHGYPQQSLLALFRAAQEGLTNVQRHAGAKVVRLTVELGAQVARLHLHDDGRGFQTPGSERPSYGLLGLRERLELVGGQLQVQSGNGQGTRLDIRIPKTSGLVAP